MIFAANLSVFLCLLHSVKSKAKRTRQAKKWNKKETRDTEKYIIKIEWLYGQKSHTLQELKIKNQPT